MDLLPGKWKNKKTNVDNVPLSSLAYLGDAVYELYIRRKVVFLTEVLSNLHNITTSLVNSQFHADLLTCLKPHLTEKELNILRRARNLPLRSAKRKDQAIHRISTSLEALIGYLYLTDEKRLEDIFSLIDTYIDNRFSK